MIQAQGARLHFRGEDGEWQDAGRLASFDAGTVDDAPPAKRRQPIGSQSVEMTFTDEAGSLARFWEAMELRQFAPCLPEPYRGAMLRRADTLMEGQQA